MLVAVQSGTVTLYDEDCHATQYGARQAFVEVGNTAATFAPGPSIAIAAPTGLARLSLARRWWVRGRLLSLAGSAALGAGGWLGGHLSYTLGVGVAAGAPAAGTQAAATTGSV